MIDRLKKLLVDRKFGRMSLAVVAIVFILMGFGMASALHWTEGISIKDSRK